MKQPALPEDELDGMGPTIAMRLPKRTMKLMDNLVAKLPPHPMGPPSTSMILRALVEAGIEALAIREGIKLDGATFPINKNITPKEAPNAAASSTNGVHPRSVKRATERAEIRKAAGCTCKGRHLRTCKLSKRSPHIVVR
jgi:hypothetical protein